MNTSSASQGDQRNHPSSGPDLPSGGLVIPGRRADQRETRVTRNTPSPMPADPSVGARFKRPNTSKEVKCAPSGVCKKCCMASFQALAQGKKGGKRFWVVRQNMCPTMPQKGEFNSKCVPQVPICSATPGEY